MGEYTGRIVQALGLAFETASEIDLSMSTAQNTFIKDFRTGKLRSWPVAEYPRFGTIPCKIPRAPVDAGIASLSEGQIAIVCEGSSHKVLTSDK